MARLATADRFLPAGGLAALQRHPAILPAAHAAGGGGACAVGRRSLRALRRAERAGRRAARLELERDDAAGRHAAADADVAVRSVARIAPGPFIHLVDAQGRIVAEDNRPPQDGAFPMLQWVAGDWIRIWHRWRCRWAGAGEYRIRVGLFDPRTDRRARACNNQRGRLRGDYLDIGSLIVGTRAPRVELRSDELAQILRRKRDHASSPFLAEGIC